MPLYTNLDGTTPDKTLLDVIRWQLSAIIVRTRARRAHDAFVTPRRTPDAAMLRGPGAHLTWIGHATFLLRLGGKVVATDPIWSSRIHTVKRVAAAGVPLDEAPPIDVVTVSHSHYDHLDMATLKRIGDEPLYVVPKDVGSVLRDGGLSRVVELGWWESHTVGDLRITLVPAHHWSMRTPWDRNRRLWGGFVYEGPEGVAYHAGDTAFNDVTFRTIRERSAPIDWAMLPIGAYDPPWFMQPQHMGPEEAVSAFELLGARVLCAMHWGTFRLTDEPLGEPPERLRARAGERSIEADRLWVMDLGETRRLDGTTR